MGENHFQQNPVALYGIVLLLAAIAYKILSHYVIKSEGRESVIGKVLQNNKKEYISMALYASGVVLAFVEPIISVAIYISLWLYIGLYQIGE